ncbi:MAG: hypothetical protein Q8Q59_04355 [Luteolibacter sp.]|nr:hypothetical protein [Luteolibacter sp.]
MRPLKTLIRLVLMAVLAVGFTSCERAGEQEKTHDSTQTSTNSKRGDRKDSPSSRRKFESGLKTAEETEDPAKRNEALAALATDAMEDRPDLAQMAILKLTTDSPELPGLMSAYLTGLLESGSDDALAWANSLEDEEMSGMARELIAQLVPDNRLGTTVPRALDGGKIAGTGFKPGDELMLQRWAIMDPQAAAAWLANMPVGETRNEGFRNISRSLVQTGDETAVNWLNSLPSEGLRANAREAMAAAVMETPEPIRIALLGPPESGLRMQLGEALARLQPPPGPAEEQGMDDPAAAGK